MTKLIPLNEIPSKARKIESSLRRAAGSRERALEVSTYRIVTAPGCHSEPYFDPPVLSWVLSREAAEALSAQLTHMPGGTSHHRVIDSM
jgi:hypothetical protein